MVRLLAALTVPAILITTFAPAAPVPKVEPVYYFPSTVGDEWVIQVDGKIETTSRVTAVDDRGKERIVTTAIVNSDGTTSPCDVICMSSSGVTILEACGFPINPPLRALKLPANLGVSWERVFPELRRDDPPIVLSGYSNSVTMGGTEEVVVPAGRFKAIRLNIVWTSEGG